MTVLPSPAAVSAERVLALAAETLDLEAKALLGLKPRLGDSMVEAVRAVLGCNGRLVVMGMGKSGHVGRKIAATLASTGTPAMFVHPGEASHGDLGMVTASDIVLAISNSGESDELNVIVPVLKRLGTPLIAMTGNAGSSLARHADMVLDSGVEQEACPLSLAPTSSTTAQMALGDALAVALLDARGFGAEDFARSHPGGALGRRLLVHVADLLPNDVALPAVAPETMLPDMLHAMSKGGMGIAAVVDAGQRVLGVFTDGDLRRLVETGKDLRALKAAEVMKANPRRVRASALAVEAAEVMEVAKVTSLLVVDDQDRFVGTLNTNALLRAKVI
jgi:arabinose-5-phosphate isomerase